MPDYLRAFQPGGTFFLVKCPHEWPHSSFHRFVIENRSARDWCCGCEHGVIPPDRLDEIAVYAGE